MWRVYFSLFVLVPQVALAGNCSGLFEYPLVAQIENSPTLLQDPTYMQLSSTPTSSLFISDRALLKSRALSSSQGEIRGRSTMFGFGLTRQSGADFYVEDFVSPDPARVFWIDESTLVSIKFIDTLLDSKLLVLALQKGKLVLRSGAKDIAISQSEWKTIRPYLEIAGGQILPPDYRRAAGWVRKRNFHPLQTGWQMVVTSDAALLSSDYVEKLARQARKQKLNLQFVMHQHRAQQEIRMQKLSAPERIELFSLILQPTVRDLRAMEQTNVQWFEIRTPGTPDRFDSKLEATSRFFHMEEIRRFRETFSSLFADLLATPNTARLTEIETELAELETKARLLHLELPDLASYALGSSRFDQLVKQITETDLFGSAQDLLLSRLLAQWIR